MNEIGLNKCCRILKVILDIYIYIYFYITLKKCKMVSVFTWPDVNTREVGRTRDKRRKPLREAEWFPAYHNSRIRNHNS